LHTSLGEELLPLSPVKFILEKEKGKRKHKIE
jgi:hypothetical protein